MNYADDRIAMFDTGLFDHRENEEDKKSFILEMDLEYLTKLHEREDENPLAPEVMTIEPELTGEMQHTLRAQYIGAACPYSRKLICSFFLKKHNVVQCQMLRFYLDRGMRLVKLHRAIRFKSSPYFASYIANNTAKRKQFKHGNVNKAFDKLMTNTANGKTIENAAQRTDIRLRNDIKKARRLAEKPQCKLSLV